MRQGRYYLGRVVKLGRLTQDMVVDSILDSPIISVGKFAWAVTDAVDMRQHSFPFVYGKLSKFAQEGPVRKVDVVAKAQVDEIHENLLIASSPFVYLPEYSGVAYLHVWNEIQEEVFPRRLQTIIEAAYQNFFVQCKIEAISDYSSFISKINELDRFTQISAKVHPPNPLFGRLWRSLENYINGRNVDEFLVRETSPEGTGLNTDIFLLMHNLLTNSEYVPDDPPTLTDAALLMAADGYGSGKVVGIGNGRIVVVHTSETKRNFQFDKDPSPELLAKRAWQEFIEINRERDMEHE